MSLLSRREMIKETGKGVAALGLYTMTMGAGALEGCASKKWSMHGDYDSKQGYFLNNETGEKVPYKNVLYEKPFRLVITDYDTGKELKGVNVRANVSLGSASGPEWAYLGTDDLVFGIQKTGLLGRFNSSEVKSILREFWVYIERSDGIEMPTEYNGQISFSKSKQIASTDQFNPGDFPGLINTRFVASKPGYETNGITVTGFINDDVEIPLRRKQ